MSNGYDIIAKLTTQSLSEIESKRIFKDFSITLGWEPSDSIFPESDWENNTTNGHLIVEHGLDQSTVITFLLKPLNYVEPEDLNKFLTISYNNLIDWHIYVEHDKVSFIYNRRYSPDPIIKKLSHGDVECLKSSMFEQITEEIGNPNFPALDEVLINNISSWKRRIAVDLNDDVSLKDYSVLFNSLIFTRALEDHARRYRIANDFKGLTQEFQQISNTRKKVSIYNIIKSSLVKLTQGNVSREIININKLKVFDNLSDSMVYELVSSFYRSRNVPYSYDFAIMSKHALSRIYEHYVSILRFDYGEQLYFIKPAPEEHKVS